MNLVILAQGRHAQHDIQQQIRPPLDGRNAEQVGRVGPQQSERDQGE